MADCEQLKELYEAYALGALEGEEVAELEAHLTRACPACTPGVQRARWLVSQLAYLAPEVEPPASVRRKILEAVSVPKEEQAPLWVPTWTWVGAAALILLTLFTLNQTRRYQEELVALKAKFEEARKENQTLASDRELFQRALAILSAPGTKETKLKSAQASAPVFRAYWHAQMGMVISGQKIPLPAADRALQLWVVPKKGSPISAGVFRPGAEGRVLMVSTPQASPAEAAALAITDEPAGGSPQPTTKPIWVGSIS